jgi:hypothetical protein
MLLSEDGRRIYIRKVFEIYKEKKLKLLLT